MTLSLQLLYDYLFGNRSKVPTSTHPQFKEQARSRKNQEIKKFFIGDGLIRPDRLNEFRNFLREINNPDIEIALFGEPTRDERTKPFLPDSNEVKANFALVEDQYHYFPNDQDKVLDQFKASFYMTKIIASFIEPDAASDDAEGNPYFYLDEHGQKFSFQSLNGDRSDTIAYLRAYKMLVLFGISEQETKYFSGVDTYLKEHNFLESASPLHDIFVYGLAISNKTLAIPMKEWQKIILATGYSAVRLFVQAVQIAKAGNAAPKSYEHALKLASTCYYENRDANPAFADLCMQYNAHESIFEKALQLEKHRKKSDNLPDIWINGKDMDFPGYHLVKLPLDDMRAYILGAITNCCQSLSADAEQAVIDGITLASNGFYVLLKNTKKADMNAPPMMAGKIDYSKFQIVGQGYAWLTTADNLTFDSWENLKKEPEDKIIMALLRQFAVEAIKLNPAMLRVTIGIGGRTPKAFAEKSGLMFAESMREGTQYPDSKQQALVYVDTAKRDLLYQQLKTVFMARTSLDGSSAEKIIRPDMIYSVGMATRMIAMLNGSDLQIAPANIEMWEGLYILFANNLMTPSNVSTLGKSSANAIPVAQLLVHLSATNQLDDSVRKTLEVNGHHLVQMKPVVDALIKAAIFKDTIDNTILNIEKIIAWNKSVGKFDVNLAILADSKLLNIANMNALLGNIDFAHQIAYMIVALNNAGILEAANRDYIVAHAPEVKHANLVCFCELGAAKVLSNENFKQILLESDISSSDIKTLSRKNLLSIENINLLIGKKNQTTETTLVLAQLNKLGILTDGTRDILKKINPIERLYNQLGFLENDGLLHPELVKLILPYFPLPVENPTRQQIMALLDQPGASIEGLIAEIQKIQSSQPYIQGAIKLGIFEETSKPTVESPSRSPNNPGGKKT